MKKMFFLPIVSILIAIMGIAQYKEKTNQQESIPSIGGKKNEEPLFKPNAPVGIGRGIFPGRVVWAFDTAVSKWDGKTGYWWEEANTSQVETNKMFHEILIGLSGQKNDAASWNKLFVYFNETKKKISKGYSPNEKIAIKINQNNSNSHHDTIGLNGTPQLIYALLKSLIKEGHITPKNITVFDASRYIQDDIFYKCHKDFPEVIFMDNSGGDGRTKSTYVENKIPYSADNGKLATGLVTCVVEADYLINMALMKGHIGQGVTLCAKNFYGTTNINSNFRMNAHNNFNADPQGKDRYMTFVDFLGHKDLGEKTVLFLIDNLYGARSQDGPPLLKDLWKMQPFNGRWGCSLFASQDAVAIDAVGMDFLSSEWPDLHDLKYADKYLLEAALANDPPSKTFYDPERDGSRLPSLGVLEHWNNSIDKKYSRNLGKNEGIELVYKPINNH